MLLCRGLCVWYYRYPSAYFEITATINNTTTFSQIYWPVKLKDLERWRNDSKVPGSKKECENNNNNRNVILYPSLVIQK